MEERNKGSGRFQGQGESSAGQERKQKMAPPKMKFCLLWGHQSEDLEKSSQ